MRLPGSRYQEHGWEYVRKLLASVSLPLLRAANWRQLLDSTRQAAQLDWYTEAMALALHQMKDSARCQQVGNSYGESAQELAYSLLCELRALPAFWDSFIQALRQGSPQEAISDAALRKKIHDLYSSLRDKVDADNYQVASGLPCSANKIYTWRMLDTASHEVCRIVANWPHARNQIEAILGRACPVQPIETARCRNNPALACQADWIINWSASLAQFGSGPGPLHTRSKRFASLKNQPDKIAAMLEELREYAALSGGHAGFEPFDVDREDAHNWLQDYQRILQESEAAEGNLEAANEPAPPDLLQALDQMQDWDALDDSDTQDEDLMPELELASGTDETEDADSPLERQQISQIAQYSARLTLPGLLQRDHAYPRLDRAASRALCQAISLPPDYLEEAAAAEDQDSICYQLLAHESLPVRLSVYQAQLGPQDDSYPASWLDPRSGQLPTCKQLAALAQVSLPTLRKRRAQALALLQDSLLAQQCARYRADATEQLRKA